MLKLHFFLFDCFPTGHQLKYTECHILSQFTSIRQLIVLIRELLKNLEITSPLDLLCIIFVHVYNKLRKKYTFS